LFRRFLESYVEVCNNIVTEAANNVLMFEAGEQAALTIRTLKLEDINAEFEKVGITISIDKSEKKIIFHVKGLTLSGKKCEFCDILRGFFGGLSRKHIDPRFYCRKSGECILKGENECIFIAEMVE
jgi:predicted hydrocarbon binding protein